MQITTTTLPPTVVVREYEQKMAQDLYLRDLLL
jgi:hypothetical protein